MPRTHVNQVKKGKLKMLLFFLVVTFFIWFLTKFSKEFTATVEATIQYENLPNNTVLASNNTDKVSFDLTSSGFDFLSYRLKKPTVTINVFDNFKAGNQIVTFSNIELIKIITSELNSNIAVKNVSLNEVNIALDVIVSREIPINVISEITYQNGFKAVEELTISPNLITVSGPSLVIDSLGQVFTKSIKLNSLSTATSGEIEIDTSNNLNLSYSVEKVLYSIAVEEFTQKELSIPIKIENLPLGTSIKLLPDAVSIVFDVSVSKFNAITENDFIIVCDYNKRNIEENYMIPELVKKPIIIKGILLKNDKINYLVFK